MEPLEQEAPNQVEVQEDPSSGSSTEEGEEVIEQEARARIYRLVLFLVQF
jgi:hypothetical protein